MYCHNCGKEIEKGAKFCSNCGTEIVKEKQEEIQYQETQKTEIKQENISMNWFEFYRTAYLGFIVIINIISVYQLFSIRDWNTLSICLELIAFALYILIPIILILDLPKRKKYAYNLLMFYLIIDYPFRAIITALNTYYQHPSESLLVYILICFAILGIWFIPNMIYFGKRANEFKQ